MGFITGNSWFQLGSAGRASGSSTEKHTVVDAANAGIVAEGYKQVKRLAEKAVN
jgi:hypothetical protein